MKKKSNVKSLRICKIKKRPNEKCLHKIVQFFIDMKLCLETSKNSLLPALSPLPSLPPTQLPSCFTLHPLRQKKPSSYPPLHAPIPTPTPIPWLPGVPMQRSKLPVIFHLHWHESGKKGGVSEFERQSGLFGEQDLTQTPAKLIHVRWMNEQKRWCLAFSLL